MKKKILGVGIVLILITMLLLLTGCGSNNSNTNDDVDENSLTQENENKIDYSSYTDLYATKITSASFYYYGIEDLNNDGIPELFGKSASEQEPNFKVYKLENEEMKEIRDMSSKTNFAGIEDITKNEYADESSIYVINQFGSDYIANGSIIDFAYIKDNIYTEYGKLIGMDLDTLSNSKMYKRTLNFETLEITEKEYDYTIDISKGYDNALVSSEYEQEIANVKEEVANNLNSSNKIEFYENNFSEWEHDNTELKEQVKKLLKAFSETSEESKEITVNEGSLTLENFKKVMQKRNLTVNSVNNLYQVEDYDHSTYYTLNVFESNEDALRWWNNSPKKSYYKEENILETVKNEESTNTNKYEIVMKNGTIYIDYRENNYFLSATIQNDGEEDARSIAEEIFAELGF